MRKAPRSDRGGHEEDPERIPKRIGSCRLSCTRGLQEL